MNPQGIARLTPLTGVIWAVLFLAATLIIGAYDYLPSSDRVLDLVTNDGTRVTVGAFIGSLSVVPLIWFAGSLRIALREPEKDGGRLSAIAFGGAIAAGAVLAVSFTALMSAAVRAGAEGGITAVGAVTLFDFAYQGMGLGLPMCMGVLVGATGFASLRTSAFPRWFGLASIAVALVSISPVGYIGMIIALVWVPVVGVWLYMRNSRSARPEDHGAPRAD